MSERTWQWLGLAAVALVVGVFGFLNGGEQAAVHLGVVNLYQLPLVPVLLAAFLLGMLTMFLVTLRHDVQLRRELRARGLLDPPRAGVTRADAGEASRPSAPPLPAPPVPEPEPPPAEPM